MKIRLLIISFLLAFLVGFAYTVHVTKARAVAERTILAVTAWEAQEAPDSTQEYITNLAVKYPELRSEFRDIAHDGKITNREAIQFLEIAERILYDKLMKASAVPIQTDSI